MGDTREDMGIIMEKSQMIVHIQDIIQYLRIQNYNAGIGKFRSLLQELQEEPDIRELIFAADSEQNVMSELLSQMMQALEAEDMVLLADLLEEGLLSLLRDMVIAKEPEIYGNYSVESTSSGLLTIKHLPSGRYLHSNTNPMEEARVQVAHAFEPEKENYAVWGLGLGYHVVRLYEAAAGAISITVFEEDEELLELACRYGALSSMPKENVRIIVDKTGAKFAAYLSEKDAGLFMHLPSVKKIQNKSLRDAMMAFFPGWNGTVQFRNLLAVNFRSNRKYCSHNVDELAEVFQGKEAVIVAGGPSLDHSLEFLRYAQGDKVIIAVATVWKKLLDLKIVPDYIVVMDALERTYGQFPEGGGNVRIPLILDSTACWRFAANYSGEKYIAYQRDYDKSEKCAEASHNKLYETGGSVTTLALEIVLQSGARAVYFVGADFAYPGGLSHADGTMDRHTRDLSGMEPVKSVDGGIVYADNLFLGYRRWIEEKIKQYPQTSFYNLSDCGAYIAGTLPYEK